MRWLETLEIAEDDGQQVVEVVSDPSRELPECLHPLRLNQRGLRLFAALACLDECLGALGDAGFQLLITLREQRLAPFSLSDVAQNDQVHVLLL